MPLVRKAITHVLEQRDEAFEGVSEGGVRGAAKKDKGGGVVEGEEQRLLMLEGVLKEVIDAQQALKDEHKEDTVSASVCVGDGSMMVHCGGLMVMFVVL